jgi:Putative zinc-finger
MRFSLFNTCQESHALMYARQDRDLSLLERGALRSHLWVCKNCPTVQNNIALVQEQLKGWRQSSR